MKPTQARNSNGSEQSSPTLNVYFDGLCHLCSREIAHYQKTLGAEKIRFVDICGASFDATKENLDPHAIHEVMHVRKADGTVVTRMDAFIEIWRVLPRYTWAASLASKPLIKMFMEVGYSVFAKIRPLLPKKKRGCSQSPHCQNP